MKPTHIPLCLAFALFAGTAHAQLITGLTALEDSTTNPFNPEVMGPGKAIDGSGLPDNEPALSGTHSPTFSDHWWTFPIQGVNAVDPQLTIDLNANYALNTIQIWNYNEGGVTMRGVRNLEIHVSPDDDVENLVKLVTDGAGEHDNPDGDFLLPRAPGVATYTGFELDLAGVTNPELLGNVRLVRFIPLDSYDVTTGVGLAEVQFAGTLLTEDFSFRLVITHNHGNLDFSWDSRAGKLYDLVTSTDLDTPIPEWEIHQGYANIPGTPPENMLENVDPDGDRRFFAMIEKDVPPIFSADFEEDDGGFTVVGAPNDWAWGAPDSRIENPPLNVTTGNQGSARCWGTNLGGGDADFGGITPGALSILRSPEINLSGVTGTQLAFAAVVDAMEADTLEVRLKESGTDELLATLNPVSLPATESWQELGPFALPEADGKSVYLEFVFQGSNDEYIGFYLDDVSVTVGVAESP